MIRLKTGLLALLVAAVMAFHAWTALSTNYYVWRIGRARQGDYYNLLAGGMLAGHLHLKVDVPESLVHAEDPYDRGGIVELRRLDEE